MKVLKAEVKTIYTIAVTADDYAAAKNDWMHNLASNVLAPKAFDNDNLGHIAILQEMKNYIFSNGDKASCLASYLGYDGWENAGIFDERTNTIKMVVYKYGDCLQKGIK